MNKKDSNILMESYLIFAFKNYASVNTHTCIFISVPAELIPLSGITIIFAIFKCYHYLIDAAKEVVPVHLSLTNFEGFSQGLR